MKQFDSLIIGEVARDTNVDYDGTVVQAIGGAVYYSGFAAAAAVERAAAENRSHVFRACGREALQAFFRTMRSGAA